MPKRRHPMKQLISVRTAAEQADVSTQTVRRWIQSGALPALKISARLYRLDPDDLQDFLNGSKG